jgi:hypothetical protein
MSLLTLTEAAGQLGIAVKKLRNWVGAESDRKPTDYVFPAKDFKVEEARISKMKTFWNPEKPVGEVKRPGRVQRREQARL